MRKSRRHIVPSFIVQTRDEEAKRERSWKDEEVSPEENVKMLRGSLGPCWLESCLGTACPLTLPVLNTNTFHCSDGPCSVRQAWGATLLVPLRDLTSSPFPAGISPASHSRPGQGCGHWLLTGGVIRKTGPVALISNSPKLEKSSEPDFRAERDLRNHLIQQIP